MSLDIFLSLDILISAMIFLLLLNAAVYALNSSKRSHTAMLRTSIAWLVAKQRIELNPGHIGLRDVGDVAARALGGGRLCCRLVVGHGMMAKREEAPPVRLGEALGVFHRHVDAVVLAVEEPAP